MCISQAIQGGFDASHTSGLYAGTWGSNVDFNDGGAGDSDPSMELDLYGGFAHEFDNGIGIDLGLINYHYPRQSDFYFVEYYAGAGYSIAGFDLSGSANYSNDVFGSNDSGTYYTLGVDYGFDTEYPITVSASGGYYDFDDSVFGNDLPDSYKDWKICAAMKVNKFTFDISHTDTDDDGEDMFGNWGDSRLIGTLSASF